MDAKTAKTRKRRKPENGQKCSCFLVFNFSFSGFLGFLGFLVFSFSGFLVPLAASFWPGRVFYVLSKYIPWIQFLGQMMVNVGKYTIHGSYGRLEHRLGVSSCCFALEKLNPQQPKGFLHLRLQQIPTQMSYLSSHHRKTRTIPSLKLT